MAQFNTYGSASALTSGDTALVYQSGAVKQATMQQVLDLTADASRWIEKPSSQWTATAASSTSITFSDTSGLAAGLPLRVVIGAATYYVIIDSISGSTVNVRGPSVSGTISAIHYGKPEQVSELSFYVSGYFAATTSTTLLDSFMNSYYKWRGPAAYAVQACAVAGVADSSTAPTVQVLAGGNRLIDGTGLQLSTAGTWVESTLMNASNYAITRSDSMELEVVTAGGGGDAQDMTVTLTLVLA
jgi:hypothetical protein